MSLISKLHLPTTDQQLMRNLIFQFKFLKVKVHCFNI